jgi:hypothetical protein
VLLLLIIRLFRLARDLELLAFWIAECIKSTKSSSSKRKRKC